MDNVTHTLVGLALGEALGRSEARDEGPPAVPGWLLTVSVLANNLPDVDVLYAFPAGGKLGYLLHHRGHTHTVLGALLQGVLLWVLVEAWLSRRPGPGSAAAQRLRMSFLCLLGPMIHLWMDSWNLYGIHPWWPAHDAWLYGDRVFVLEPWLWALLMPAVMARPGWSRGRWVLLTLFLLALGLGAGTGAVPGGVLVALPAAFALSWLTSARLLPAANTAALALAGVVVLVTALGNLSARVKRAVRVAAPGAAHDVVTSPAPADPRCWLVMTVEGNDATDTYRVRRGAWSLTGSDAARCLDRLPAKTVAPLRPSDIPDTPALAWRPQFEGRLSELRRLAREHCRFRALLQFARAPTWHRDPDGTWVYGDLRFDRGSRAGFSQLVDPDGANASCRDVWPAPWIPPVQPLLQDAPPKPDSTKEKP